MREEIEEEGIDKGEGEGRVWGYVVGAGDKGYTYLVRVMDGIPSSLAGRRPLTFRWRGL